MFSNAFEFEPIKRCPSIAQKFSIKIWNCRELNKEELFPLECLKIQNGI
jgi:hypothetical protein